MIAGKKNLMISLAALMFLFTSFLGVEAAKPMNDGLCVNGLLLFSGISHDKIKAKLGKDESRFAGEYQGKSTVNYVWKLKSGGYLTAEIDKIGALIKATLAADGKKIGNNSFAVLDSKKVLLLQTTLGEIRKLHPGGVVTDSIRGEGYSLQSYVVPFGPENSYEMVFTLSWEWTDGIGEISNDKRDNLKISSVEIR
jgi:hypothetical protein